ncbi:spermidine/putrescine ABC transporter permease [Nesterenkonia pannonica]|uniref:spermidine/putrescine ABC transporter permease n=1 Tax=Nesterenkonia pannonica TaxID=1548602 RepID=UPI002164031E|nr:spermidine/putrescine ABC transporter permease [Nesterenkonia pannonica]
MGSALRSPAALSLFPLGLILGIFFILPIVGMAVIAFSVTAEDGGTSVGLANFEALTRGSHLQAIANSVQVSLVGSTIAAAVGSLTAFCIAQIRSKALDSVVAVFSSVLANDGGAPLAFSFIVTLGNAGVLYAALNLEATGFTLYSWQGLVVMYQYFLIPTMVMVTLPTFMGLRKEWREANAALGGSQHVLAPRGPAGRRTGPAGRLDPVLRRSVRHPCLRGGPHRRGRIPAHSAEHLLAPGPVPSSQPVAMALGVTMVVIAVTVLFVFNRLQRRSARWVQ